MNWRKKPDWHRKDLKKKNRIVKKGMKNDRNKTFTLESNKNEEKRREKKISKTKKKKRRKK